MLVFVWVLNELQSRGVISLSLQGSVSFGSNGIREAKKLQVYQYRYQGKHNFDVNYAHSQ